MPLNERARNSPKFIFGRVGAGVAQLGVSRRGRRFVVCAPRSLRGAKKHPTAVILGTSVSIRDSRPRAHPAGQHGPCAEVREVAGLTFPRLHFGGFAPRAWRVSAGRLLGGNRGFFGIAPARLVLF